MNALESPEYQRLLDKLNRLPLAEQVTEWRGLFWTLAGRSRVKDVDIRAVFDRFADEIERSGR